MARLALLTEQRSQISKKEEDHKTPFHVKVNLVNSHNIPARIIYLLDDKSFNWQPFKFRKSSNHFSEIFLSWLAPRFSEIIYHAQGILNEKGEREKGGNTCEMEKKRPKWKTRVECVTNSKLMLRFTRKKEEMGA